MYMREKAAAGAANFPVKASLSIKQNYRAAPRHYRTNFRFVYFNQLLNVIIFTPSYFNIARVPEYAGSPTRFLSISLWLHRELARARPVSLDEK